MNPTRLLLSLLTFACLLLTQGAARAQTPTPTIVAERREAATDFTAFRPIQFNYDLPSCTDGTSCVTTVPFDGCLPGDFVRLNRPESWTTSSVWITGERCSGNNLLEFTVTNENGGAFDPNDLTYTGLWWARRNVVDVPETPVTSKNTPTPTGTPTRTPTRTPTP